MTLPIITCQGEAGVDNINELGAAIEDYLERASPLPFVAGDLFINFDDGRVADGFEILGQLAQKTQVLFFTHHQHLVEIARTTLGRSVSVISLH